VEAGGPGRVFSPPTVEALDLDWRYRTITWVLVGVIFGAGYLALMLLGVSVDILPNQLTPAVATRLQVALATVFGATTLGLGTLALVGLMARATGAWPRVSHRLRLDDLAAPEHPLPVGRVGWRPMAAVRLLSFPLVYFAIVRFLNACPLPLVLKCMTSLCMGPALFGLWAAPLVGAWVAVREGIARGSYERADRDLRLYAPLLIPLEVRWLSARAMLTGSHPERAEAIFRMLWRDPGGYGLRAHWAAGLGWALVWRGESESAHAAFVTAVRGDPHLPSAWEGMVVSMLLDGERPGDSAACLALGGLSACRIWNRLLDASLGARFAALRAWTLAASGRADDARGALAEAWIPDDHVPAAATAYWYRGHALERLGDAEGSRAEFERGAAIDPGGSAGRCCRAELLEASVAAAT